MVQIIPRQQSRMERFAEDIAPAAESLGFMLTEPIRTRKAKEQMAESRAHEFQKEVLRNQLAKERALESEKLKGQLAKERALEVEQLKQSKPLTSLQKAQEDLAKARTSQLESVRPFFEQITKKQQSQFEAPSGGVPTIEDEGDLKYIQNAPMEELQNVAAFAGQPGEMGVAGNIAKAEIDRRKEEKKEKTRSFESERAFQSSYSKKAEEDADKLRQSLPKKEMALTFARNAIETGDVSFFSPDNLADATGFDIFRTAKGAQLITAGKENLLSNMSRVGAKAQNIWFEQRLNSMFPKIGQDQEANLTVQEMLEGESAIDRAYLNAFDRMSEEDEKEYGFVKKDISKRAYDAIKPMEKEILKRTTYRMREIEEQEKGLSGMKAQVGKNVIKGTPLTLAMAKLYKSKFGDNALSVAEKNGYYIPTLEEFKIFQQRPEEFREELGK